MGRIWLLAALAYGYGHPGFDGHRLAALDRPLRQFHRTVDLAATDTRRLLVAVDDVTRNIQRYADGLRHLSDVL